MLTPQDMQRFEQSMLDKLERAQAAVMSGNSEQARECLAFHIIGGGLSGVELAFELSTRLAELIPNQYPALSGIQPAISLIEANPTILPACTPFEQKFIARKLERKGVRLYLGYRVTEVTPTQLILNSQSDSSLTLPAVDALWVAGMKANLPEGFWGEQSQADVYPGSNRVKVNAYLEVPERPNIYVIGDASGGLNTKTGKLFPVTGQIAAQQAQYVARDISLKLHGKFRKRSGFIQLDKGHMVSMGPGKASMTLDFLPKPLDQLTFYGPLVAWFRHTYYGLLMRR
jgi:NADH dehydrogenase